MSNFKLYEINALLEDAIAEANQIAEENEGVLPDDFSDLFDEIAMERNTKILDIARYVKSLNSEADVIKAEKMKLASRQKQCENLSNKLKNYILFNLQPEEILSDANTKLSWRKSEGIIISDESSIPEEFVKIERKIQVADIKKAIKSGIEVLGAQIETRNNLQIK